MAKKLIYLLVVIGFLAVGAVVFAQQREMVKPGAALSTALKAKIEPANLKLGTIESILMRVESQKIVRDEDSEELGKTMYEYAEAMKAAYEEALKDAEAAAKSNGKEGSVESLKSFEETAKAHEEKLRVIEAKAKAIEDQIKKGTIKLDKTVLQKVTPNEMEEFKKFLEPQGLKEMEKLHPDLFKPGAKPKAKPGASINFPSMAQIADNVQGFCNSLSENISDFFVSPAEAKIAASCLAPCLAQNWSGCASCIASHGPEAKNAWNEFVKCWNGCGKCWKPWTWWCKAKCLGRFIAKLA